MNDPLPDLIEIDADGAAGGAAAELAVDATDAAIRGGDHLLDFDEYLALDGLAGVAAHRAAGGTRPDADWEQPGGYNA